MLSKRRLLDQNDVFFEPSWSCYLQSFPVEERRPLDVHLQALGDARYHMDVYFDEGGFAALFFYWEAEGMIYGEHFAIHPQRRSCGLGTMILQEVLEGLHQPLVLEIEPLQDETSRARWRFYQSLGFHLLPYDHRQLRYRPQDDALHMHLLSYPSPLTAGCVARFQSWLASQVIV